MKQELITEVMQQMLSYLDNAQLKQLKQVMEQTLFHYEVTGAKVKSEEDNSNDLIAMFIAAKRIEGCSGKTLMCRPLRHGDLRRWACHCHRLGHLLRRDADALFQPQKYASPRAS